MSDLFRDYGDYGSGLLWLRVLLSSRCELSQVALVARTLVEFEDGVEKGPAGGGDFAVVVVVLSESRNCRYGLR